MCFQNRYMDKNYTHIVPVGHTKEMLISSIKESIKKYPITKVVFILGINEEDESEKKARKVADEVEKALGIIKCERSYTDLFDIPTAANDLVNKVVDEEKTDSKVLFNLSGSLRTIDIAGYIAAVITKSDVIVGIPKYRGDKIVGIKEFLPAPTLPLPEISTIKLSVLALLDDEKWKSLDELSRAFDTESDIKIGSKKSKISFHLEDLKKLGFIETEKKDKNKILFIRINKLGLAYYNRLK